jgi:hypothetical protein
MADRLFEMDAATEHRTMTMNSMRTLKTRLSLLATVAALAAAPAALAAAEEGFQPLFNGKDTTGWKLRNPSGKNCWVVEDGILKNNVPKGAHGTDLLTEKKYRNFVVRYEFMVPDNSNSGFYLRGRHEIQILGDAKGGKVSKGCNGALYAFKEPDAFVSKPATEWQTAEVTMIGNRITMILNGQKIHDNVVCDRPTGGELDNKVNEPGPFLVQGDHGTVWFRNLRVKELPQE